jgi:hypothetical protein
MTPDADLLAQADAIRSSGILGRSGSLQRLFDFLVQRSLQHAPPKEIEIAIDVFGKDASFDVARDALVRVYVHKLRAKLAKFYSRQGPAAAHQLVIPKGEYRVCVEPARVIVADAPTVAPPPKSDPAPARHRRWIVAALAAVLIASVLANIALLAGVPFGTRRGEDAGLDAVRGSPVWAPLLHDQRPIVVVLGDYYIFGEMDQEMNVGRLVRDFSINSAAELERHLQLDPAGADHYMDVGLSYLPVASGPALRNVIATLAPAHERIRVVTVSGLDANVLKSNDVIYIGYLSGLGMLQDLLFSGSRYKTGETYDEIIDRKTNEKYVSGVGGSLGRQEQYRDYGYFSTFAGPTGNRIIVIAGTRDAALVHTAEQVTSRPGLADFTAKSGHVGNSEALYEVYAMDRAILSGKLLRASPLDTPQLWTGVPSSTRSGDRAAAD